MFSKNTANELHTDPPGSMVFMKVIRSGYDDAGLRACTGGVLCVLHISTIF